MTFTQPTRSAFQGVDIPDYDVITNCMHCGLCLPYCPTYALTGLETSSPRGRIRLIKAVADGDLLITEGFIREMNFCLDCQACETACPAGVRYGSLVEAARAQIFERGFEGHLTKAIKRTLMGWTFSRQGRLKMLARLLRGYERSGLMELLRRTGILKALAPMLEKVQPLSPPISTQFSTDVLPEIVRPRGEVRYRVGFLTGCVMDVAFADVNVDTVRLLLHHGCEVVIPRGQGCCGSLQAHNGDLETARGMARAILALFDRDDLDYIVMNSAGCGAFMKEYADIFAEDPELGPRAARVSRKVKDVTEFLIETGYRPAHQDHGLWGKRISYHDACHLAHTQKVTQQPRELLKMIPHIELLELPEATWCCGSAGIYNITHYEDSMKLLDRKVQNIKSVRPDILVTGNPGCLVQIGHGLRREGLNVELMHTATLLWRACEADQIS
jgi:glycolate oxidase iron-sulfur subunit